MDEELYVYQCSLKCEQAIIENDKIMTENWWKKRWKTSVSLNLEQIAVKEASRFLKIKE